MKKILIVGAGLGGLSTALRLAKSGYEVCIVEKNNQAGGRLNQLKKDGFTFDTGPSFFSMSYEFEEFAKDCGITLPFEYFPLDPLYSVNFKNNPHTFHLYKDSHQLAEQFKVIEPDFEIKMNRYLDQCKDAFHDSVDVVIKQNFDSLLHYLKALIQVHPKHVTKLFQSFWQIVTKKFDSKEAKQIVSLVAFFLGRTPFDTSGIYTLLSYTEFKHDGYFNVKGGMYAIVEGIVAELKKANVTIIYNTEIVDFKHDNNKITAMIDEHTNEHTADIFLVNSDAAYFRGKVLKKKKYNEKHLNKKKWTMGYLTFYVGIDCKLPQVDHHNYYLGNNYKSYAKSVLSDFNTDEKPYYYVNVVSKHNNTCAPEGCESLFFVCPVPNLMQKPNWDDKDELVTSIIEDFGKRIGKDIRPHIISKTIYTPLEWQNQFNLYKGSGLGLAHNMLQIGYLRAKNSDEDYKNVFYVGASTIPGAGLPMAIISSKLAYERISTFDKNN